jgi:hypothetical protein
MSPREKGNIGIEDESAMMVERKTIKPRALLLR